MKDNESIIGELLQLKDDIAQQKHLIQAELRDEWNSLKKKTKALEPQLSGTLLSLVKRNRENEEHHFIGSDGELIQLLNEFKQFQQKLMANKVA